MTHRGINNPGLFFVGTRLVIAGRDLCFRPAQSALDGRTLLVWHDQIEAPVAVRYAWAGNPAAANLMNTEGEPAGTFCTQGEMP